MLCPKLTFVSLKKKSVRSSKQTLYGTPSNKKE